MCVRVYKCEKGVPLGLHIDLRQLELMHFVASCLEVSAPSGSLCPVGFGVLQPAQAVECLGTQLGAQPLQGCSTLLGCL